MPQFGEPLRLLQRILDFQAALAEQLEAEFRIELAVAQEKWQAGHPLLAGESLSIPSVKFLEALADLRLLLPAGEIAQTTLDQLLASSSMASSNVEALLVDLASDSDACIQRLAETTSTDPGTLAFLTRTVLSPFFAKRAAPYWEWVETSGWRLGICPVCGSEPWMARLSHDSGRRILACSLCRTEWSFDRLRCPFCDGDDQPQVRHFTVDDKAHRVYCCDRCQRYIKTVDERVLGRAAHLMVEDVITAHLDAMASELGYQ
jgi:FdhE protein